MSFYERYAFLCRQKGIDPCSQATADMLGVTKGTISAWKRNDNAPKGGTVSAIADALGVSADYLLGRREEQAEKRYGESGFARINVYGTIPAGIPMNAVEDIIDTEDIPLDWLEGGREYFALRVKGDSMYPVYLDGDTVIFRKATTCRSGDDCVVYIGESDATLKRVKLNDDGSIELRPINPNYPPRIFTSDEVKAGAVTIGGIAVELRRKMVK